MDVAERSLPLHGAIRILPIDPGSSGAVPLSSPKRPYDVAADDSVQVDPCP